MNPALVVAIVGLTAAALYAARRLAAEHPPITEREFDADFIPTGEQVPAARADSFASIPVPGEFEYELTGPLTAAGAELARSFGVFVTDTVRKIYTPPAAALPYVESIARAEHDNGIPQSLLARVLYQESRYRPEIVSGAVRSGAGATGIAQLMPATARELGVDPLDAEQSIDGAARYLRRLYDSLGDWAKTLAAYNWGIGNVQRRGLGAAPLETRRYVSEILADVTPG
jgi:soluble lytic murein transglycosylase-like protein